MVDCLTSEAETFHGSFNYTFTSMKRVFHLLRTTKLTSTLNTNKQMIII